MKCDEIQPLLSDHLLGTLQGKDDMEVRRHLRACSSCRAEMAALAEGVDMLARASHEMQPPSDLKPRVLAVLEEEWAESAPVRGRDGAAAWLVRVAAAVVIVAAVAWGLGQNHRAVRAEAEATRYDAFLGALGGEAVRVGVLKPEGSQALEGSAVIYDSKVGQSWVLLLVRAPGMSGEYRASVSCSCGGSISLRPIDLDANGEGSTWLVTSANLRQYDGVSLIAPSGAVVATGHITGG